MHEAKRRCELIKKRQKKITADCRKRYQKYNGNFEVRKGDSTIAVNKGTITISAPVINLEPGK